MFLTPNEIKEQTRQLWQTCFEHSNVFVKPNEQSQTCLSFAMARKRLLKTNDYLDIFFEDKYTDKNNLNVRRDGQVVASLQSLPYRFTFYGAVHHAAQIAGLAVHPDFRGKGFATNLLHQAHRRLFEQGATLSFLIPPQEEFRSFFERAEHGHYWTSVYRQTLPLDVSKDGAFDKIEVVRPDEWPTQYYVFFHNLTASLPFMVHPAEHDFFAALSLADLQDGYFLVARKKQRITGLCLAVKEADGQVYIRTLAITDTATRAAFVDYLRKECGVEQVYRRFCLPGGKEDARPYAMARVVNVPRFLQSIARPNPGFQLHIGVDGDLDIPENNGWYIVENGRVELTDQRPTSIVTPGGLAAMFMAAQPMVMDLLLDE